MSELVKQNAISNEIVLEIEALGMDLHIGDMFFDSSNADTIIRIRDVKKKEHKGYECGYVINVSYDRNEDFECTEWRGYGSDDLDNFKKNYYEFKLTKPINEYLDEIRKIITGEIDISTYQDTSAEMDMSTALVGRDSKQFLNHNQLVLEQSKKRTEMVKAALAYEMEIRKAELNQFKKGLDIILADFKKKITKIVRLITTIELYLGIEEELIQIQEGEKSSADETLCFRQQVLYMDEEVGIYDNGGIDFQQVHLFDEWLTKDRNFEKVIPEQKGVVVFNPRRKPKDYGDDNFHNAIKNESNKYDTYILIRNGECIYRIFSDKIAIRGTLFPLRKEFDEMMQKIDGMNSYSKEEGKEKMENMTYNYQMRAMLLQGLIDRTECFSPMTHKLSLFKLNETPEEAFKFIYDAEATLPTGRKSFWDWWAEKNALINEGSRVLLTGLYESQLGRKMSDIHWNRLFYNCENGYPDAPLKGVYTVEIYDDKKISKELLPHYYIDELHEKGLLVSKSDKREARLGKGYETYSTNYQPLKGVTVNYFTQNGSEYVEAYECNYKKEHLTILYNPYDTVYGGWTNDVEPHERKKRIRWKIKRTDRFVINYDQIDIEDIDFYLNSRVDRHNYADMLPILARMKEMMLKEKKSEDYFAEMVFGLNINKWNNESALKEAITEAIAWWKYKNKWKRPIDKDDAKALRMIQSRLKIQTLKK